MARPGRKPVLDDGKRREILAILSVGCSRRVAAQYVGCDVSTIRNTADRDPAFADALQRAEGQSQLTFMKNIHKAAKKEQYWRAAAWALERINPEDFARPNPDVITTEQILELLTRLTEIIIREVPEEHRDKVVERFEQLKSSLQGISTGQTDADDNGP